MSQFPGRRGFLSALGALAVAAACSTHPSVAPVGPTAVTGGGAGSQSVQFSGLVGSLSGACPSVALAVGSRPAVAVLSTTVFEAGACTDIRRGTLLDIRGSSGDKGVVAERIRVATDGPGSAGLVTDVAAGGYVLFFRHADRDANAIGNDDLAVVDNGGDCVPGSELTAAGRTDAAALGERFRRYGIDVQQVFASPTCRTTEMARLAFGGFDTTRTLTWNGMWAPGEGDSLAPGLRRLLGTVPGAGKIIVLISHNNVLLGARVGVDVTLDPAEAAVFRPHGAESFEFRGKIPKSEWLGQR